VIEPIIAKVTGYLRNTAQRYIRDAAYPVPAFRLAVDGLDIAQIISPRLMSLELTDNRGVEADQLSITLSDRRRVQWCGCGWAGATQAWWTKAPTPSTKPNIAARRTCSASALDRQICARA
jgi:hypothetical protein